MTDFNEMMKQAQSLQQKLQDAQGRLAESRVEGLAGGGLVKLTLKGSGELLAVSVDDSLLASGEGEMISDLLIAAHADAKRKLDAEQAQVMQQAMGPLAGLAGGTGGLPGMPGLKL